MSQLQRRYLNYFYRVEKKPDGEKLIKTSYMKSEEFQKMYPGVVLPGPQGKFMCKHEERDFISSKGKKKNHTKTRMKRKRKARIRARRAT